jgi:hypothetical protein
LENHEDLTVVIALPRSLESRVVPDTRIGAEVRAAFPIE